MEPREAWERSGYMGYIVFLILFVALGSYSIVKGILLGRRASREDADYDEVRKKSYGYIWGGIVIILLGIWRFYTRYYLWGWR